MAFTGDASQPWRLPHCWSLHHCWPSQEPGLCPESKSLTIGFYEAVSCSELPGHYLTCPLSTSPETVAGSLILDLQIVELEPPERGSDLFKVSQYRWVQRCESQSQNVICSVNGQRPQTAPLGAAEIRQEVSVSDLIQDRLPAWSSIHSFTEQVFIDHLLCASVGTRNSKVDKADAIPAITELKGQQGRDLVNKQLQL